MRFFHSNERGFTLIELLMTIAVAATLLAIGVPVLLDVSEGSKLTGAARELERELQSARLKAVTSNRLLRVRLNCPAEGYYRTVEVLGTAADNAANRCLATAYPYPAADNDVMTRPNYDGPTRFLPNLATMSDGTVEFRPDGTAHNVVANVPQPITSLLTLSVTRNGKTKAITVNGTGKIQYQLQ